MVCSLYALTNTSATANATAVDLGASSTLGGQAHIALHSSQLCKYGREDTIISR